MFKTNMQEALNPDFDPRAVDVLDGAISGLSELENEFPDWSKTLQSELTKCKTVMETFRILLRLSFCWSSDYCPAGRLHAALLALDTSEMERIFNAVEATKRPAENLTFTEEEVLMNELQCWLESKIAELQRWPDHVIDDSGQYEYKQGPEDLEYFDHLVRTASIACARIGLVQEPPGTLVSQLDALYYLKHVSDILPVNKRLTRIEGHTIMFKTNMEEWLDADCDRRAAYVLGGAICDLNKLENDFPVWSDASELTKCKTVMKTLLKLLYVSFWWQKDDRPRDRLRAALLALDTSEMEGIINSVGANVSRYHADSILA